MANLITEIFDKQAVIDNLNQLGELINSSLNAIVSAAPKLQSPIDYMTALKSVDEIEKESIKTAEAKKKALSDLDKLYQQADKAIQQYDNLADAEYQTQTNLLNQYKEMTKEQKQLIEIERTRNQTMQNSQKLLSAEAKTEAELRLQTQQLIKASQSLRLTNADENKVREQLIAKINANKEALKGMTNEVSKQKDNIGNYKSAWDAVVAGQMNVKQAMAETRNSLVRLEALVASGVQLTADQKKRYDELNATMGKLTDIQGDMSARAKALSNDYLGMQTALEGLKFGANALGAVQSATAMLGVENEELVKTIQKLQAVQTFANSVGEIQKSLNKDSALMVGLRVVKEKLLTAAIGEQTKAQLALNAAKLGFAGLLAGAVVGLGVWIAKMASAKNEVADLNKELNKQATEAVAPTIQKVNDLKDKWSELGGNLEAQKQFLQDNKTELEGMGLAINDVASAETFFNEQTQDFIDAQIARAKADATRAKMTEIIKEQLEAQMEYERRYVKDQKTFWEGIVDWYNGAKFGADEYAKTVKSLYENQDTAYKEQITDLSKMAEGFDAEFAKLTANIPVKNTHAETTKKQADATKELNIETETMLQLQTALFKMWDEQEKQAQKFVDILKKANDEVRTMGVEEEEAVEPVKTLTELLKEQKEATEKLKTERKEAYDDMVSNIGSAFDAINGYYEAQQGIIDRWYENEKEKIEASVTDQEERNEKLTKLDEEKTKKDKEIAKQQAEIKRRQAIFQNSVDAAAAMSKAVASVGELLATSAGGDTYTAVARYIAAIAAGVEAVATISTLIAQMLNIPAFEKGGVAEADKPFIAGEKGREIGFGQRTGKVYDFASPAIYRAPEPVAIKTASETNRIINNEYNKDVTLHNEVVVQVIDNKRIEKFFKI